MHFGFFVQVAARAIYPYFSFKNNTPSESK